ncbi:MAG: ribbon-helix-helix domain-containing protein [Candidatus Heimdallarchaeota archaeon]
MVDEVVNSRITKEDLELLDQLVALGYYSNRSEAIRALLSKGLKDFTEKQQTTSNLELLEPPPILTDKQLEEFGKSLFGSSIVKLVAEGRER